MGADLTAFVLAAGRVRGVFQDRNAARVRQCPELIQIRRLDGSVVFDPPGAVRLGRGETITLQAALDAYRSLRSRMERAA